MQQTRFEPMLFSCFVKRKSKTLRSDSDQTLQTSVDAPNFCDQSLNFFPGLFVPPEKMEKN